MQSPYTDCTLLFLELEIESGPCYASHDAAHFWSRHLPSQLSWTWLQEHLDYDLVESSNPAFAKAIVRINVFRNHRQVSHPPPLLVSLASCNWRQRPVSIATEWC